MAQPLGKVKISAREELLTSDIDRIQDFNSAQQQNQWLAQSAGDDFTSLGTTPGTGISRGNLADCLPSMGTTSGFGKSIGEGQAYILDLTGSYTSSLYGDESQYWVIRWPTTNVTFATPHATNPRIDLVIIDYTTITAAQRLTDSQSRNVLMDPIQRTVTGGAIYKTDTPIFTPTVLTGTAAASPSAPALTSTQLALFEVYIPPAVANATFFRPSRRLNRRTVYPNSTFHGILKGCVPIWSQAESEADSPTLSLSSNSGDTADVEMVHKVSINGEIISFHGGLTTGSGGPFPLISADIANDPFTVVSYSATTDTVYYIYACGGQGSPQGSNTVNGASQSCWDPIAIIESLTAPTKEGYASAALQGPRGAISSAATVLIGVGYIVAGSTGGAGRRKSCTIEGDWIYANTGESAPPTFNGYAAFNAPGVSGYVAHLGGFRAPFTFTTQPNLATHCDVLIVGEDPMNLTDRAGITYAAAGLTSGSFIGSILLDGYQVINRRLPLRTVGGENFFVDVTDDATVEVLITSTAYNMGTKRAS